MSLAIHHLGYVVADIREKTRFFMEELGYTPESDLIHEVHQKVLVRFLRLGHYRIELIAPAGGGSPVASFLARGGGLHHLCYESPDLENSVAHLRKLGYICTSREPSASIAECAVAFLVKPAGDVIEILQPRVGTKYLPGIEP